MIEVTDRAVQFPNRFKLTMVDGTTDTYDLTAIQGTVTNQGTALNKSLFDSVQSNILDNAENIKNANGGFSAGNGASATTGGAVGSGASATTGAAVGSGSQATTGAAIGSGSQATTGAAIGAGAISSADGAVQLGKGTNNIADSLQFKAWQILTSAGFINGDRIDIGYVSTVEGGTLALTGLMKGSVRVVKINTSDGSNTIIKTNRNCLLLSRHEGLIGTNFSLSSIGSGDETRYGILVAYE